MSATLEGPRLLIRARSRPSLLQFLSPVAWQPGSGPFLSLMWSQPSLASLAAPSPAAIPRR